MNNCPITHTAPDGKTFNSLEACQAYCDEFPWVYVLSTYDPKVIKYVFIEKETAELCMTNYNKSIKGVYTYRHELDIEVIRLDLTSSTPTIHEQMTSVLKKDSWLSKIKAKYCKG